MSNRKSIIEEWRTKIHNNILSLNNNFLPVRLAFSRMPCAVCSVHVRRNVLTPCDRHLCWLTIYDHLFNRHRRTQYCTTSGIHKFNLSTFFLFYFSLVFLRAHISRSIHSLAKAIFTVKWLVSWGSPAWYLSFLIYQWEQRRSRKKEDSWILTAQTLRQLNFSSRHTTNTVVHTNQGRRMNDEKERK